MERLTRRAFLVAGGGVVLAAGGGLAVLGPRRVYDHFTRDEGPAARLPAGSNASLTRGEIRSEHSQTPIGWVIAVPAGVEAATLPICYCLPGRDSNAAAIEHLRIPDFIAESDAPPFIVASLDSGVSYWHRRKTGEDRRALLLDDFIPFCEERLGLENPRRGLLGWSMGGYGALLAAERRPELFEAVVAVSPALWRTQAEQANAVPDAFDDAADYARNDVYAGVDRLRGLAVRVDCGADDPFRGATEAFRDRFDPPPSGGIMPGVHNLNTWQRFAPAEVAFLGNALA